MAAEADVSAPAPHIVGNVFVEQYYNISHQAPEEVHKFYKEVSVLSRPGADGEMVTVRSLKGINDQILSFDFKNSVVQILTADSQASYEKGVIVLVTGYLTGKDKLRRKFTQNFFLAPENGCYFVLNDVFRYVDEPELLMPRGKDVHESAPVAPPMTAPQSETADVTTERSIEIIEPVVAVEITEAADIPSQPAPTSDADVANGEESIHHLANGNITHHQNAQPVSEPTPVDLPDAPKKSFASIVQSLAGNASPFVKVSPPKPKVAVQSRSVAAPATPASKTPADKSVDESVKIGPLYIANLPMNATDVQLREIFEKFGPIIPNSIQVRSFKMRDNNCFGFLDFESASSMRSVFKAHQASPITIDGRILSIQEKRAGNNGGKPSGRNAYRNQNGFRGDGFRGRDNFNGGRNGNQGNMNGGQNGTQNSVNEGGQVNNNGMLGNVNGGAQRNLNGDRDGTRSYVNGVGQRNFNGDRNGTHANVNGQGNFNGGRANFNRGRNNFNRGRGSGRNEYEKRGDSHNGGDRQIHQNDGERLLPQARVADK